jgi:hypothetical protein
MKLNLKKWLTADEELKLNGGDTFYAVGKEESLGDDGSTKMILLEPRAFSEATQIVDFLRQRNTVVVNLKELQKIKLKELWTF